MPREMIDNVTEIKTVNWISISDAEYKKLTQFVYDYIGINLTEQKRNLLMGRLQKVLREKKFNNFTDYYNFLVADKSGAALSELANFISTNHTFFWRENDHFEFFQKRVMPEIVERKRMQNSNDIRIWCAGCSTGEEPYTLVMLMKEALGASYSDFTAGILATDISEKALDIARAGKYSSYRMKSMPEHLKKKYFKKIGDDWHVIDSVKSEVTYRRFNLMNDVFPFKKAFDSIFCRNVMIYFDEQTRIALVQKFYDISAHSAYLFIGHSETIKRETTQYKFVSPAIYKKI